MFRNLIKWNLEMNDYFMNVIKIFFHDFDHDSSHVIKTWAVTKTVPTGIYGIWLLEVPWDVPELPSVEEVDISLVVEE